MKPNAHTIFLQVSSPSHVIAVLPIYAHITGSGDLSLAQSSPKKRLQVCHTFENHQVPGVSVSEEAGRSQRPDRNQNAVFLCVYSFASGLGRFRGFRAPG